MRAKKALTSILGLFLSFNLFAGHEVGGVIITYESVASVNNNPLEYYFKVYMIMDRTGISVAPLTFSISESSSCFSDVTHSLPRVIGSLSNGMVPLIGSDYCSNTNNVYTTYGMWVYEDTITLRGVCADYRFSVSSGFGRFGLMTNIAPNFNNNYFEAWLDNRFGPNSIPEVDPVDFFQAACLNKPVNLYGFIEPDGDSVYYNLRAPRYIIGTTIGQFGYNVGYSNTNPINSSTGFTIDPQTGSIQATTSNLGNFLITIGYREYRIDTATQQRVLIGNGRHSYVLSVVNSCATASFDMVYESVANPDSLTCSATRIRLATSRKLNQSSLTPTGSEFTVLSQRSGALTPSAARIVSDSIIELDFSTPLSANDTIEIRAVSGTDNDVVLSVCGQELLANDDTLFFYTPPNLNVSASFSATTNLLNASFNSSGSVGQSFSWDFGDGSSSTSANPMHSYGTPGLYNVTLVAFNNCGPNDTLVKAIRVCDSLTATFSNSISADTVFVDAGGSMGVSQYYWDFGDGSSDTGLTSFHVYSQPGSYVVTLVATNLCGDSLILQDSVKMCEDAIADWTYTIFSTTSNGMTVDFDGSMSIRATTFHWDFGDGNTNTTSLTPRHLYTTPSLTYLVTLTVYNDCNDPNVKSFRLDQVGLTELDKWVGELYPNPTKGSVNITLNEISNKPVIIELYSMSGQRVYREQRIAKEGELSLELGHLPPGAYSLRLRSNGLHHSQKLIIEK